MSAAAAATPPPFPFYTSHYYAIVFLVTIVPLMIIFTALLHVYRSCAHLTKRSYFFLLIQHVGGIIVVIINISSMATYPKVECILPIWTAIVMPLYWWPFGMRCFIYFLRWRLTEQRKVGFSNTFLMRNIWLLTPRFLITMYLVGLIAQLLFPIALSIVSATTPHIILFFVYDDCGFRGPSIPALFVVYIGYGLLTLILALVAYIALFYSKDAFKIKEELRYYLIVLFPIILIATILGLLQLKEEFVPPAYLPGGIWAVLVVFFTFLISGVKLFFLCWKEKRTTSDTDEKDLAARLIGSPEFRQLFFDFLCLQLCIENLLFWEDIQRFKRIPNGSPEQQQQANILFTKYVKSGSEYEVNIPHNMVLDVNKMITSNEFSSMMFDMPEREIFSLMKYHSYPLFLRMRSEAGASSLDSWVITAT